MDASLHAHYEKMWEEAQAALAGGNASLDSHLPDKTADRRRGATLLIRPAAAVTERIAAILGRIAQQEPLQYYYEPAELHVTVLSLFTGTEQPEPHLAELPRYRRAIGPVLGATRPFAIHFDGLTASPGALLVQGFPTGSELHDLREALRGAIHAAGLGHNLDQRYRITTAHMTAVRFCRPLHDGERLVELLRGLRSCDFGVSEVTAVDLVENDWYMSQDRVRVLHTYQLLWR